MSLVVMLATAHERQRLGDMRNSEFEARVAYLCSRFDIRTIVEEWSDSAGESLASTLPSRIAEVRWASVGTPNTPEFATFTCPPVNHPAHDGTLDPDESAPSLLEYGPIQKQERREKQMLGNIRQELQDGAAGLFIVGVAHVHSMCMKLGAAGFSTVAYIWL